LGSYRNSRLGPEWQRSEGFSGLFFCGANTGRARLPEIPCFLEQKSFTALPEWAVHAHAKESFELSAAQNQPDLRSQLTAVFGDRVD
jgi:hypothetical protein